MADSPQPIPTEDPTSAGINSPELSETTIKPKKRAISSAEQAYSIAAGLEKNNETRNQKNAILEAKYNGDPPHSQSQLIAAGEDWRSNASFGFMSSIIDRIIPVPLKIIDSVKHFTSAGLDPAIPDSETKSERFRERITKAIRQWDFWKDFTGSLVREDVLHGGCIIAWLDDDNPFPQVFRQDEAFVPEGTRQHAQTAQFFVAYTKWLIHEAVEFIEDRDSAESGGWYIENMVEVINEAMPATRPENSQSTGNARLYEDVVREGNAGLSFSIGAKVIEAWHILATETTGKVTHYIVNRRGKHQILFSQEDRFEKMSDILTLFTLEQGNSKFYGSKGACRKLGNPHIAIERTRNRAIDQVYMSGLGILKTDPTKPLDIQNRVKFPFVIVGTDAELETVQIQNNVEEFLKLDAFFSQLAEQLVGSYLPDKITPLEQGTPEQTATGERIDFTREQQAQSASWARFDGQFSNMISNIQKRLCKKDSTHSVAKEVYKALIEDDKLTAKEIDYLANRPASEVAQDMSQVENQQIMQMFPLLKGDPKVNQTILYEISLQAMSNQRIAKSLIIADMFDPTIEAEQIQKQIMENAVLQLGDSINISPRDVDELHLKVLAHELAKAAPGVQAHPDPGVMDNFSAALVHAQAHVDQWEAKGGPKEEIKKYQDGIDNGDKMLKELAKQMQQQQQAPQGGGGMGMAPTPQQPSPEPIHPEEHMLKITSSISYKDAPEDIRRQIEAAAGFQPSKTGGGPIDQQAIAEIHHKKEAEKEVLAHEASLQPAEPMDPTQELVGSVDAAAAS